MKASLKGQMVFKNFNYIFFNKKLFKVREQQCKKPPMNNFPNKISKGYIRELELTFN